MKEITHRAIVGFGANLGQREETARTALMSVRERIGELISASELFENAALLPPEDAPGSQPSFLNAIWVIETTLSPEACLNELITIEREHGRIRTYRWGARIIDLDLVAYDDLVYNSQRLAVPHPEMHKRDFVLKPLCQVWPDWVHPKLKLTALQLLELIEREED